MSSHSTIGGHSVTRTEKKYENVHKAQTALKFDSKTQNNQNHNRSITLERSVIQNYWGLKPVLQAPNLILTSFVKGFTQMHSTSASGIQGSQPSIYSWFKSPSQSSNQTMPMLQQGQSQFLGANNGGEISITVIKISC